MQRTGAKGARDEGVVRERWSGIIDGQVSFVPSSLNRPLAHLAAHEHGISRDRDIFVPIKVALRVVREGAVERADLIDANT